MKSSLSVENIHAEHGVEHVKKRLKSAAHTTGMSEWPQILSEHGSISCNLLCLMHIIKVHQGFSNEPGRGSVRKGLLKQLIK